MNEEKKVRLFSWISTGIFMVILFVIMYFLGLYQQVPPPPAKKVLLIEMSMEGGGGGGGNESPNHLKVAGGTAENYLTSSDISLPSIPVSVKKSTSQENSTVAVTEPSPNTNAAYRPGIGGGKGGGTGTGNGTGKGSGFGEGEGSGSGGGIGYGTGNRGYTFMPELNVTEPGTVYVEVHVDEAGIVVDARVITSRKYPTTITDSRVQTQCVAKAKTAKYRPGKEELRIIVFK
jgi:hypothetical protein